jgi:3-oxoadipate enol-lactonase
MSQLMESKTVMVDGRRLAYEEVSPLSPKGTILLLVGLGAKRQAWYKQLPEFGRDYRDAGDSDEGKDPYTIRDLAEDTRAVMKALEIKQAHIIGFSMGGFVALEFALHYPQMVEKLVLVVTSAGGPRRVSPRREIMAAITPAPEVEIDEWARKACATLLAPGFAQSHPEEVEILSACFRPRSEAAYFRQLAACRGHDVSGRLHQIEAPTLVIHGDVDPLVPLKNGLHLAQTIPGAALIVYPHTGHIPEIERAEQFNHDILAFLALNERSYYTAQRSRFSSSSFGPDTFSGTSVRAPCAALPQ